MATITAVAGCQQLDPSAWDRGLVEPIGFAVLGGIGLVQVMYNVISKHARCGVVFVSAIRILRNRWLVCRIGHLRALSVRGHEDSPCACSHPGAF